MSKTHARKEGAAEIGSSLGTELEEEQVEPPAQALDPNRFNFTSRLLTKQDAEFVRQSNREVVLKVLIGVQTTIFPLRSLAAHPDLGADHQDIELLPCVERALFFRRAVRSGDKIPTELSTGRPSWTPQKHIVNRATSTVLAQLSAKLPEIATHNHEKEDAASTIAPFLVKSGGSIEEMSERIEILTDSLACLIAIRNAVATIQHIVGRIAKEIKTSAYQQSVERLKQIGVLLRRLSNWATKELMRLDGECAQILPALLEPGHMEQRVWPRINRLRAWMIDIEPIVESWGQIADNSLSTSGPERDIFDRMVTIRYGDGFDPNIYWLETPKISERALFPEV